MERVEDAVPYVRKFREQQSRYCGEPYRAVIDLCHPSLDLSLAERQSLQHGMEIINEAWSLQEKSNGHRRYRGVPVLERPDMPSGTLEARIKEANKRYRQIGRFPFMDNEETSDEEAAA